MVKYYSNCNRLYMTISSRCFSSRWKRNTQKPDVNCHSRKVNDNSGGETKKLQLSETYDSMVRNHMRIARNSCLFLNSSPVDDKDLKYYIASTITETTGSCFIASNYVKHFYYPIGDRSTEQHCYLCHFDDMDMKNLLECFNSPRIRQNSMIRIIASRSKNRKTNEAKVRLSSTSKSTTLLNSLQTSKSMDEQIDRLTRMTEMSATNLAVRFFVASLIEDVVAPSFDRCSCTPFGSTVNGFGESGSDLDLTKQRLNNDQRNLLKCYRLFRNPRVAFLFNDVEHILHARVPIVKFNWPLGNLVCDLSSNSPLGLKMAKILWVYSKLDHRLRKLIFVVRFWARYLKLTENRRPTTLVKNFHLICLTIFFMQNKVKLPTIEQLRRNSSMFDNYGIVGRPSDVDYTCDETSASTAELLAEFFHFYANFDFNRFGISLINGQQIPNGINSDMYIENPVEPYLNSSANVSQKGFLRFTNALQKASSDFDKGNIILKSSPDTPWGLIQLCNFKMLDFENIIHSDLDE